MTLFSQGNGLAIKAGAGTGKTTTLAMCARTTRYTGTYLAFNRAIANDAGRAMPLTVAARTVHSIAMAAIRRSPAGVLLDRLNGARVAPGKVARILGLGPLIVTIPTAGAPRTKMLQPAWQASHVMRAIAAFCQSGDPAPDRRHFPYVDGIDPPADGGRRTYVNNRQVAAELEPALRRAWADLTSPVGQLRFTHDTYLKLWQLGAHTIPGDFLLFDEAQDANPVMLAALNAQQVPIIWVGDDQQQLYEWRGAVNAMDTLPDDIPRTYLTQSWRFGPAVADVANTILDRLDAEFRLTGNSARDSTVYSLSLTGAAPTRAVLCRTNAAAVNAVLQHQERGIAPHLVGGCDEIVRFAEAADRLMDGERTGHPELACFESWREVLEYVDHDPQGSELRMLVQLIQDYGTDTIIAALDGLAPEDSADVIVSTAHKAKGREWTAVRLGPDFELPEDRQLAAPELRLLYVAATRGIDQLDVTACQPLRDMLTVTHA